MVHGPLGSLYLYLFPYFIQRLGFGNYTTSHLIHPNAFANYIILRSFNDALHLGLLMRSTTAASKHPHLSFPHEKNQPLQTVDPYK